VRQSDGEEVSRSWTFYMGSSGVHSFHPLDYWMLLVSPTSRAMVFWGLLILVEQSISSKVNYKCVIILNLVIVHCFFMFKYLDIEYVEFV
jgi:hypothetical protein